jgi:hypothetical protein
MIRRVSAAAAVALLAVSLSAQSTPTPTQAPAPNQPPPSNPMDAQMRSQYAVVKSLLTRLADKMPAEAYSFAPTPEMAPFVKRVAHVVAANYGFCANLVGKPNPKAGAKLEDTLTTKEMAMAALAESFAFCDEYAKGLTLEKLAENYEATATLADGQRRPIQSSRGGLFANYLGHANEMYGYLSVYLRLKGIVPPSSEPRPARGRGGR